MFTQYITTKTIQRTCTQVYEGDNLVGTIDKIKDKPFQATTIAGEVQTFDNYKNAYQWIIQQYCVGIA